MKEVNFMRTVKGLISVFMRKNSFEVVSLLTFVCISQDEDV